QLLPAVATGSQLPRIPQTPNHIEAADWEMCFSGWQDRANRRYGESHSFEAIRPGARNLFPEGFAQASGLHRISQPLWRLPNRPRSWLWHWIPLRPALEPKATERLRAGSVPRLLQPNLHRALRSGGPGIRDLSDQTRPIPRQSAALVAKHRAFEILD